MNGSTHGRHVELPRVRRVYESLSVAELNVLAFSRRSFLGCSLAGLAAASTGVRPALGQTKSGVGPIAPALLRRALDALTKGSAEHSLQDERLHQFVRSLEGLILPEIAKTRSQFIHRCQTTFVSGNKTAHALDQIFNVRSKVEHLHSALDALPEATNQEKEKLLYRRARQIDQLARFAISRILENDPSSRDIQNGREHRQFLEQTGR